MGARRFVDAAIMRGGTSRGVVLGLDVAPLPGTERDELARLLIGRTAVEGLGGGSPVTNKIVLVGASESECVDLDYIVGNVSADGNTVDWSGTCGNMTSAVVPYGAVTGALAPAAGQRKFQLRNLSTLGLVDVAVADDSPDPGDEGTETKLTTSFMDSCGLVLGHTLPTGRARDTIEVDGESFDFSLLDVTHPYLFLLYSQVVGARSLDDVATHERIESIRGNVCVRLGLCMTAQEAATVSAAVPRVVLVHADSVPLPSVRITAVSMGECIRSVPVTAALSLAAARQVNGTVLGAEQAGAAEVEVVGPAGTLRAAAVLDSGGDIRSVSVERTARVLMRGRIHL